VLTPRQAELLAFLRDYAVAHRGVMPSYSEICAALGLRSKGRVSVLLDRLVERGHLRRLPARARALELLEPSAVAGLEQAAARLIEERGAKATAVLLIEVAYRMMPAAVAEQP
jgi:SOS-response transcriptional repressor LexA